MKYLFTMTIILGWIGQILAQATTNNPYTTDYNASSTKNDSLAYVAFTPTEPARLVPLLRTFEVATVGKFQVQLKWQLDSVTSLDHFEVMRSQDGYSFETFATIEATQALNYQCQDQKALMGYNYYCIRLYYKDQSSAVSRIQVMYVKEGALVQVFPNPVGQEGVTLQWCSQEAQEVRMEWVDARGGIIQEQQQAVVHGTNMLHLPTQRLLEGIYVLNIYQQGILVEQCKIVKND